MSDFSLSVVWGYEGLASAGVEVERLRERERGREREREGERESEREKLLEDALRIEKSPVFGDG